MKVNRPASRGNAGRSGCAARANAPRLPATPEETDRRLSGFLTDTLRLVPPGHVSPAAGLMDLRWVVKPDTD
jgi:hypothetical protein